MQHNYIETNKILWNQKTDFHLKSDFYGLEEFIKGKSSLKEIELALLGDVKGKSILHLQCHFGQDTITLARMGAVTIGLDFSDNAIDAAKDLAQKTNVDAKFVCANVYDTRQYVKEQFDIVFTSYGTIGWLEDLSKWAEVIAQSLKKGGKLVFVEFHPVLWMFDNDFDYVQYSYFKEEAIVEYLQGTYADKTADIQAESISWNHSLTEVFEALLQHGLTIKTFKEYNYSPYDCFAGCQKIGTDRYVIEKMGNKLPMVYAIVADK